ncbi:NAD(P)/FAD-dependent oxidoreductase [Terrabacter sp. 2YAF2]|uniref:NAD(P)/FAD-dependent oxidoreductase n=1 Tax=Terrabacter sp. 2YAF2 TaxID=3233026 RepID=UPI003F947CFA
MSTDTGGQQGRTAYVIVGGGLAAAKAVEGIRESDSDGMIVLVAEENRLPYERPPLSKAVLKGEDEMETAFTHDRDWYFEQGVELRLGNPATSLDAEQHTLTLADGETLSYDKLLIATGSTPRALDVPGADLDGVLYLREMQESEALKARFADGARIVIVGAGWIGLEVAAAARDAGCTVTVIEPQSAPLVAVMGEQVGGWFADLHRGHGVEFRFGEGVERIEGDTSVTGVVTKSGDTVPADAVVVGVGITPNTGLAEGAGITTDNGIVADPALRTSAEGVWAAGDVANWRSTTLGTNVRVEHWANANDGGLAAGRSMAGQDVTYDPIPFFFSDQYDIGLEYAGYVPRGSGAEVLLRGEPSSNEFMAFWVVPEGEGVRVLAGMHVNVWDTIDDVQRLVRDKTVVDRGRLADPKVALADLT